MVVAIDRFCAWTVVLWKHLRSWKGPAGLACVAGIASAVLAALALQEWSTVERLKRENALESETKAAKTSAPAPQAQQDPWGPLKDAFGGGQDKQPAQESEQSVASHLAFEYGAEKSLEPQGLWENLIAAVVSAVASIFLARLSWRLKRSPAPSA
ncbi:MAG: hypothetical protein JNK15_22050 [Planctomycetes bacterium]|nr:hypothetical protein [Planctomycetota bacterium]